MHRITPNKSRPLLSNSNKINNHTIEYPQIGCFQIIVGSLFFRLAIYCCKLSFDLGHKIKDRRISPAGG